MKLTQPFNSNREQSKSEKAEDAVQKTYRLEQEKARLLAQWDEKEHKADKRRWLIIGKLVVGEAEENEDVAAWVYSLLNNKLTKGDERALFDIPQKHPEQDNEKT